MLLPEKKPVYLTDKVKDGEALREKRTAGVLQQSKSPDEQNEYVLQADAHVRLKHWDGAA